jgi:hypothetical protein
LLAITAGGLLWAAPAALAGVTSANWAGYAAHRPGVRFRYVTGEWQVPTASCTPGAPAFSSNWIGLGGYRENSGALEQTGTETDCSASGRVNYSAWYELVPAAPHSISLGLRPGDLVRGSARAAGGWVTIVLSDLSNGRSFRRSFHPSYLDRTSADWIVEAPSECTHSGRCRTLPLADFGRTSLFAARATTVAGRAGAITSRWWNTTTITLVHGSRSPAGTGSAPEAAPSGLTAGGSAFTVAYW